MDLFEMNLKIKLTDEWVRLVSIALQKPPQEVERLVKKSINAGRSLKYVEYDLFQIARSKGKSLIFPAKLREEIS